jgi:hypothetical protein
LKFVDTKADSDSSWFAARCRHRTACSDSSHHLSHQTMMATNNHANVPPTPDTLIGVKVSIQGSNRKFKIPLRELTPQVLPGKVRLSLKAARLSSFLSDIDLY